MFYPILIASLSFWSVALAGGFYFTRRYLRASERRNEAQTQIADLHGRVERLEAVVARLPLLTREADGAPLHAALERGVRLGAPVRDASTPL